MKLGNRGLLCNCDNTLVNSAPYCDDCYHKDPSLRLEPIVALDPSSVLNYVTDPSNTYLDTNKVYEFPQKKYKMLPKQIRKNKCNNIIEKDNRWKLTDPNLLYEKEYYNPNYLKLKYGDYSSNNTEHFNGNKSQPNNNIIIIILIFLILFILMN